MAERIRASLDLGSAYLISRWRDAVAGRQANPDPCSWVTPVFPDSAKRIATSNSKLLTRWAGRSTLPSRVFRVGAASSPSGRGLRCGNLILRIRFTLVDRRWKWTRLVLD